MESLFQNATTFFLIANPIGNSPAILSMLKEFPFEKQRHIMLREGLFALIIALLFQYSGQYFLQGLGIQKYALTLCGGIIQFLVAIHMIFSTPKAGQDPEKNRIEPFLVPIATPLISGPGLLTIILLQSGLAPNPLIITSAILIAWVGVLGIMVSAPYLQKILGKRGLDALEQLMGLMLALVSTNMLVRGMRLYLETL